MRLLVGSPGVKAPAYNRRRTLVDVTLTGRWPGVRPAETYATLAVASARSGEHDAAQWCNTEQDRALLYELLDLGPDDFEVVEDGAGDEAERA